MSSELPEEHIGRRRALALIGLAATGLFSTLAISEAEAQTIGMERRAARREFRHERRVHRHEVRHERRMNCHGM